jgi:aldehyde dehydrogenase
MALTNQQVDAIARQMLGRMTPSAPSGEAQTLQPPTACGAAHVPTPEPTARGGGVHAGVDAAVDAASRAFHAFQAMTLDTRNQVIAKIRTTALEHAESLARDAHLETGLGRWEDKLVKNRLVARKTPGTEALRPSVMTGDRGMTLQELAPFGVIGSITPSTNPTSTIICNTIGMLAAGNAVVFNVHPMATTVCNRTVKLLNRAILAGGGPPNLVTSVETPSIESAQSLMTHRGVRLLVVTGGHGVVQAAMASGKRAICAGPGNPPVVVDETAKIAAAGRDVVQGASFDNNVICTDEKEAFVVESVAEEFLSVMQQHGAVVLSTAQTKQVENLIFKQRREAPESSVVHRDLIGKDAALILAKAGITANKDVRLVVMDVDRKHPLVWTEQLMPVFPVVRVSSVDEAIDLAVAAEGGRRHTAAMHSHNIDKLSRMARLINCSIFVKNGPCYSGLGEGGEGFTSFSIASPTGEGLTDPVSFSRRRRCVLVDHFRIV